MASAKFLEEALSTDVDESAVNAIVGSLETQLVTSSSTNNVAGQARNHEVSTAEAKPAVNGTNSSGSGSSTETNDNTSPRATATASPHGMTANSSPQPSPTSSAVVVVTSAPQQQQANFVNQVTTNQVAIAGAGATQLAKVQAEHLKIVYSGTGQVITAANVVNANASKITFPAGQNVAQLANGSLGVVTTQTVLQQQPQQQQQQQPQQQTASNAVANVQTVTAAAQQQCNTNQATINLNKPTALVIKTSGAPGGMVSVPMSVPVTVAANITNTQQQAKPGVTSTIVPSNVQILNVNAMRPGTTPVAGQQQGKQVASRVVINPHVMTGRAGTPGITLQTLQGLQGSGPGGHLLLKTENGQYQLLRVGPVPQQGTPAGTVTQNSIAANTMVATAGAGGTTTYRLASLPATVAPTVTTTTSTPVTSTINAATTTASNTPAAPTQASQASAQLKRQATDNTKEKCRRFLANLLELSSREPRQVERSVRTLIQELIDVKVEPEEFCVRLETLLNASPQPCLIGFLKKSLPLLRQSLVTKELVIEGIRPPPANVVFSIATVVSTVTQNQIRPTVAVSPAATGTQVVASSGANTPTATPQVRVMAPMSTVTNVPRPPQPVVQQRVVQQNVAMVRPPVKTYSIKAPVASTVAIQQHHPTISTATSTIRQASGPVIVPKTTQLNTAVKTLVSSPHNKSITTSSTLTKTVVPSIQPKPATKEKEKKTFSSAGYTGDDDINDVAAMGGVNLAEESQRILGSTKFVGTQIRSCKDEVFLHMTPLQEKINEIVTSYGLEEPNQEVAALISHAAQERLKNLIEKLAIIAEHRIDFVKVDPRYEVTQDVRAQLKFLEELDKVERKRHEEQEREVLLKAAKSRTKTEDPEQAKLKAKAKEMQRVEMEEARTREANATALQAIGPRKKPKLDIGGSVTNSLGGTGSFTSSSGLGRQMPLRPRLKRVNFRDLLFLLEQEKETCRSTTLYKSYLK
ncbi:transcription initiation factor TFIID subunit 4-like isoform X2 [Phymastichus coffea]|uniref:transcription initiation factor TFIID subunit 4-like isoform X2 n=1 Tax=Phymastichus coffea TaxID=108790 RepID=UPI00273B86A7|nr:transcription initiation factor TFIID subunit 4-like isoform X2 [Phymastichus coffea]